MYKRMHKCVNKKKLIDLSIYSPNVWRRWQVKKNAKKRKLLKILWEVDSQISGAVKKKSWGNGHCKWSKYIHSTQISQQIVIKQKLKDESVSKIFVMPSYILYI